MERRGQRHKTSSRTLTLGDVEWVHPPLFFASVRKRLKMRGLGGFQWHANESKCAQAIEEEALEWLLMSSRSAKNERRDFVDEILVREKRGMAGQS